MTLTSAGHVRSLIDRSINGPQQLSVDVLSVCTILATNIRINSISCWLLSSYLGSSLLPVKVYILLQLYFEDRNYSTAGVFKNSASLYYLNGGPQTAAGFLSLLLRSDH
jgi:hypothetical protein